MKIGLIDADLLDNGTRHPNIALEKISAYHKKELNNDTRLLLSYEEIDSCDEVYISKVYTFTKIPSGVIKRKNVFRGGTGFFFEKAFDKNRRLPDEIEHYKPDYELYKEFIDKELARGIKQIRYRDYIDYSIGFATRGCFRKCQFCVNKRFDKVWRHAPISEFLDKDRKYIYLWDDNILGFKDGWRQVFDELEDAGKRFQFRQGLDIRLMDEEKARVITSSRYIGDFIFAFDHLKERALIEKKLKIWKKYCTKTTKMYLLCAYESKDAQDIEGIFKRIEVLMSYRCLPYIMRFEGWQQSEFKGMYINLARWCNQPDFFKKKSFREYCEANGENSSTMKYLRLFEHKHPAIAKKYFDLKYEEAPKSF